MSPHSPSCSKRGLRSWFFHEGAIPEGGSVLKVSAPGPRVRRATPGAGGGQAVLLGGAELAGRVHSGVPAESPHPPSWQDCRAENNNKNSTFAVESPKVVVCFHSCF